MWSKCMQHADSRVDWLTSLNHCLVQFCPRKLGQNPNFTVQQLLVSLGSEPHCQTRSVKASECCLQCACSSSGNCSKGGVDFLVVRIQMSISTRVLVWYSASSGRELRAFHACSGHGD